MVPLAMRKHRPETALARLLAMRSETVPADVLLDFCTKHNLK
jgi:hypothetical protein